MRGGIRLLSREGGNYGAPGKVEDASQGCALVCLVAASALKPTIYGPEGSSIKITKSAEDPIPYLSLLNRIDSICLKEPFKATM